MENYLMLNGKRIDLTDEQVESIFPKNEEVEAVKKSPFERVNRGGEYFAIDSTGEVYKTRDENWEEDTDNFECANYCTDKAMMEQRALHETLNRLLWRYSEEHGGDNEWDYRRYHWHIVKNEEIKTILVEFAMVIKRQGIIYFKDKETAQSAINEIINPFMKQHPEFVW